jgi:hypothetical protein
MFLTYSLTEDRRFFPWKRLIWLTFITAYAGLFFYNCLRPFRFWPVTYLYTMFFILWLDAEYFEKHLFLQTGYLPSAVYDNFFSLLFVRSLTALFFYSAFVLGVATAVWWPHLRIPAYPVSPAIGIILLAGSVYLRRRSLTSRLDNPDNIIRFYPSLALLLYSLAFGYSSYLLLIYVTVIGLPVFYLQIHLERKTLRDFAQYTGAAQKFDKLTEKNYLPLWEKFISARSSRRKK